jgi:AGCS family alanine or glycine:cation symporter
MLEWITKAIEEAGNWIWQYPATYTVVGGGILLMLYSRFAPLAYFRHAVGIMQGKYDQKGEAGEISHYQALAGAISATVGMGNISGVAVAIAVGGPGAIFWMWISAILGMITKFFECSLSIMYRKADQNGDLQGGPMYYMELGLGKAGKAMGIAFAIFGLIGCLPLFTANQLTEALRYLVFVPAGFAENSFDELNLAIGLGLCFITALVILGGIKRIGEVAGYLFPVMVGVYVCTACWILGVNIGKIPAMFSLVLSDAFTAHAVQGGTLGSLIIVGVRRAAFSNEAGIGTSPMMHSAAKTNEPIREGLVAMLGPFVDTIIICTITGLIITLGDVWHLGKGGGGVHLTALALDKLLPAVGRWILLFCAVVFAITTLFSYSYYGVKCFTYLFGQRYKQLYVYFYLSSIVYGAISSVKLILGIIDLMYALMILVNVPAVLLLAPKVQEAFKLYKGR